MLSTFPLLMAAGVGLRLALSHVLHHRYDIRLVVPPAVAALLVILATLPGWLSPLYFPLPLSLTLGLVLPDLLTRRA